MNSIHLQLLVVCLDMTAAVVGVCHAVYILLIYSMVALTVKHLTYVKKGLEDQNVKKCYADVDNKNIINYILLVFTYDQLSAKLEA